ncbi:MAG TPA: MFS transporter [Candidatus Nanopelagicales bacterium]|nr:MFS transporter [Candidatus Nanopelagicales bacterium]
MPREPLLTRPFVLAFVAQLFHSLSYNLYLHLPGFLKELGAGELEIGVLFGVTAATAILARPLLGRIMDRRGRRPVILGGGVLAVISCALYLTVTDLGPWTYVVRILQGLAEAMLFASLFALAADILPPARRIEGIGLFGVAGMLPIALGGLIGDALLAGGDYRPMFAISAALAGAALLSSLPLREPAVAADREPARGFGAALGERDLLPLWFIGLIFAVAIAAPFAFLKTFVLATGEGTVGGFFALYAGVAVALRVGLGGLPERVGPKRVLFPAFGLLAAGLGLLAVGGAREVLIAGVLCGAGHGYGFPILLGLVVSRSRPSERGAALSIFTALFDGGMLVGGPLLGALIRTVGYEAMFASAAAILAVGTSAFALWDRSAATAEVVVR